ncbi:MAG: 2Fe-2S iron-sulfur cluster binding domain-containing protein, partial [Desulfobacterales bacterium]|nr:2Fe-2S iron-sulfur cluster binding domain-containing protein [Desulfobacterales bacterium]
MIFFKLNGEDRRFFSDESPSLRDYLGHSENILSVKDGCSGQAACGACLVEIDGKAVMSCRTPIKKLNNKEVVTIEGFPENLRNTLGRAFVKKGAVQCGFCTPGFLSRTKILLETNPDPTREEIVKALRFNLC